MTQEEYNKVVEIIKSHQVVIVDTSNRPRRLVLTAMGLDKVKEDLKKLVK